MKILAIDTTSELGSLALVEEGRVLEEALLHSADGYAHVLLDEIAALLARHNWTLNGVDGFASASGPGTFTGVRVGLTAAKGLAEAEGKKIVAVSNLRAMAWFGTAALRAPVMDARRGDIYGAVYDAGLQLISEEVVMKLEAWKAGLPATAEILDQPRPLAGAIGQIAAHEFALGQASAPEQVDANYVRRSDAELLWKDVR